MTGSRTLLQVNGSLFCLFCLAGVNLLLPIERGFPPLTFLGPPITVATVISLLGVDGGHLCDAGRGSRLVAR